MAARQDAPGTAIAADRWEVQNDQANENAPRRQTRGKSTKESPMRGLLPIPQCKMDLVAGMQHSRIIVRAVRFWYNAK